MPVCTVPSCPRARHCAVPVHRLEQRTAEPGLPHSILIPGASSGVSPSLCHAGRLGCHRLSRWGPCVAPPVPGGWEALPGHVHRQRLCPGAVRAQGDGVLRHRGLLAPRPPSADAAANIPSWLFIFRIPWQGCDCKQLIFSQGHLHPMALPRSHHGVAGCPEPLGTRLTPAPGWLPARGLWEAPVGTRAQPRVVPRSLLVAEEMRSLIVEKGPAPVEDDPDALVKGGHSRAGAQGPLPLE